MSRAADLLSFLTEELQQPVPPGARALAEAIRKRYGAAVRAVVFYGSCLRRGEDREGILDLYVLVDAYRRFYSSRLWALLNAVLPPNVFYLETTSEGGTVRAKYAVVSLRDFARLNSPRCLEAYFWGRFAQPCALIWAADAGAADAVARALSDAVLTFVRRGLPLVPNRFSVADLWTQQLRESYRAEVRFEHRDTPLRLYEAAPQRYEEVSRLALARLGVPHSIEVTPSGTWVEVSVPESARRRARSAWGLRRIQGKLLSLLRLLKGAVTFQGGVDYAIWKIERHTGVTVDPEWRNRRWRVLALCREFWRVYRQRAFR